MLAVVSVLADSAGDWGHMGGWAGGWMLIWSVLLMLLFVVFVVWLVRAGVGSNPPRGPAPRDPDERAREILAERYARGDLSTEEYRERAAELR